MADRTPNTSGGSSFFSSPASSVKATPQPAQASRVVRQASPAAAATAAATPAHFENVANHHHHRDMFSTAGPSSHAMPHMSVTPLVGTQLSFTPALTQPRHGHHFALESQLNAARQAAEPFVRPATHTFSTTPSMAVPLAFATPAASANAHSSSYVASNPLFGLTGVGNGGSAVGARKPPPPAGSNFQFHLPAFGAHASLPGGLFGGIDGGSLPPLPSGTIAIAFPPLRALVSSCLARGHVSGAVFYADKLATLDGYSEESVYTLADAYSRARHWSRAVHLLQKHALLRLPNDTQDEHADMRMRAMYLGLQCMIEIKQYEEALAACLPEEEAMLDFDEETIAHTDALLASVAPDGNDVTAAVTVREVIGAEEAALITQLARYQAAQLHQQQARGEEPLTGDLALCSSIAYLRGHLYELQSQKYHAILWYKLSLQFDVRNFESFERLTSKRLLSAAEELALTLALPFPEHLTWLKFIWLNKIDVQRIDDAHESEHGGGMGRGIRGDGLGAPVEATTTTTTMLVTSPSGTTNTARDQHDAKIDTHALLHSSSAASLLYRYRLLSVTYAFGSNADLLCGLIEYKYNLGQYREAYDYSKRIIDADPFMLAILPTYLCSLVELSLTSELFHVAHKLVAAYPHHAIAWFAVGCYYFRLRKLDFARRFFYKSTRCDCFFAPGWIGFGHTFSFTDESDQALLSYRTSHRLFEGSHLPLLFIGMEYLKTNNFVLASQFLHQAIACNPHDPLPHNELAIIAFKHGEYDEAVRTFLRCLALVKQEVLENWEPTLFNLGHAYRKLSKYDEAITAYNRALAVTTRPCSLLTAIGFTYHLQGKFDQAIDYYHKALGLNPRDTFTIDMLDRALKEVFEEGE